MATHGGSSSSSPNPTRMVTFITSDGKLVKVPLAIATRFRILRDFFDEVENNAAPFPLPYLDSHILSMVDCFFRKWSWLTLQFQALETQRLFVLPSKYGALEREVSFEFPSKYFAFRREYLFKFPLKHGALERERLFELPSKYRALERESLFELPSKFEALERERLFELPSKYQALEKERQKFEAECFGRLTDETIVKLVKAADYLEINELLDSVMPSFRNRFGLGDDKGVDFVYTVEAEAIFRRRGSKQHGDENI